MDQVDVLHKAEVRAVHQSEDVREARGEMNNNIPEAHNGHGLAAFGEAEGIAFIRAHTSQDVTLTESIPHLPRLKFVGAPAVLNLWERRSLVRLKVQVGMVLLFVQ